MEGSSKHNSNNWMFCEKPNPIMSYITALLDSRNVWMAHRSMFEPISEWGLSIMFLLNQQNPQAACTQSVPRHEPAGLCISMSVEQTDGCMYTKRPAPRTGWLMYKHVGWTDRQTDGCMYTKRPALRTGWLMYKHVGWTDRQTAACTQSVPRHEPAGLCISMSVEQTDGCMYTKRPALRTGWLMYKHVGWTDRQTDGVSK
jgi:hypothetical protein